MPSALSPMPLLKRAAPFDDPNWIFELKYDGFRALTVIENGRAQLLSRNGHPFASFSALAESISDSLPPQKRSLTAKFAPSIGVVDRSSKICCFAVGTRYERYAENFLGILYLGCCVILLRHI